VRALYVRALCLVREKLIYLGCCAIEYGNLVSVIVHVEHKVLAHYSQPDYSDIATRFRHPAVPSFEPARIHDCVSAEQKAAIDLASGATVPAGIAPFEQSVTTLVSNLFTVSEI
jgi:hypothetical protein